MRRLWKMSYNETRCHIGQHFKVWNRRLIIHDLRRVVATKNHIRKLRFFLMCCVVSSFLLEKSSQSKNLPIHPNISEPLLGCVFLYQTSSRAVFFGISLCIPPRARRWAKNPGPDIGSSRILEGKSHRVFLADLAKGASQSRLRDRKLELDGFWMVSGCFEKKPVLSKRQSCKKKSCFREKCIIFRRKSLDVSERL